MKKCFKMIIPVMIIFLFNACNQTNTEMRENSNTYDEALAKKLGADQYGMKKYVFANLKRGPNRDLSKEEANALQVKHLENIGKMAEEGKLLLAGPYLDAGDIRGIYIFDTESIDEAREWTNTDPAIKAGSLEMELRPWYGSAAVGMINEYHNKLQKQNVADEYK